MIILATGAPSVEVEGDQLAVSFPSGKDAVTIAIEPHHAKLLCFALREAGEAVIAARRQASAQIIAFPVRSCA